jgi:hypothetical protein
MRKIAFGTMLLSIIIAAPALADSADHRDRDGGRSVRLGGVGNQNSDRDKGGKESDARHGSTGAGAGAGVVGGSDAVSGSGGQSEHKVVSGSVAAGNAGGEGEHNGLLGRLAGVAGDVFAGGGDLASGHGAHGAPGPIAGGGLPIFALGAGIYWVIRRARRRRTDRAS